MAEQPAPKKTKRSRFSDAPEGISPTNVVVSPIAVAAPAGVPAAAAAAALAAAALVKQNLSASATATSVSDDKNQKTFTELFVGNLPPNASSDGLKEFLNAAMLEAKMTNSPGPIMECRHNPGSKFGFVVFRSPEDATSGLNLTNIPYEGYMLKVERPGSFPGPKTGTSNWQAVTGSQTLQNQLVSAVPTIATTEVVGDPMTKPFRELFVGNVIEGTPASDIQDFLNAVMIEVGLADSKLPGNPIMNVRPSGKFAFIELRTVDEANNALNMDGIPFQGMELRMKRPDKFQGNPTPSVTWREFMELRSNVEKGLSNVVMVGGAIRESELDDDESFRAVTDDMKEELSKYGEIVALVIPRPQPSFNYSGGTVSSDPKGVGKCFVKYSDHAVASKAIAELSKRTFAGSDLSIATLEEERFDSRDFSGL